MVLSDTHPRAEKFLVEKLRNFTASEKLNMVKEITIACQKMALVGIRMRYPEANDEELRLRLGALWLDKYIMLKVYSWNVDEKGL